MADETATTTTTTSADSGKGAENTSTRHEVRDPGVTGEGAAPDDEQAELLQDARRDGLKNAAKDKANNAEAEREAKSNSERFKGAAKAKKSGTRGESE